MPDEKAKRLWPALPQAWRRSAIVLGVIFATEYSLMIALPWLLPQKTPRILEAAVDSVLLTMIVIPVLWWTIVYPLQQAARQRDQFLRNMFSVIEDERRRVAHELHDGVGQTLTMLVSGLRTLNAQDDRNEGNGRESGLSQLAQRALAETKQLARGLRPSLLDDLGLAAAIERVAMEVQENHQLRLSVDLQSLSVERLPETMETALFRIFQECMANIVKHSGATEASIRVGREAHRVSLLISDNGHGFDPQRNARQADGGGHLGLIGMQERAALLNGTFEVESTTELGTTIRVTIPV